MSTHATTSKTPQPALDNSSITFSYSQGRARKILPPGFPFSLPQRAYLAHFLRSRYVEQRDAAHFTYLQALRDEEMAIREEVISEVGEERPRRSSSSSPSPSTSPLSTARRRCRRGARSTTPIRKSRSRSRGESRSPWRTFAGKSAVARKGWLMEQEARLGLVKDGSSRRVEKTEKIAKGKGGREGGSRRRGFSRFLTQIPLGEQGPKYAEHCVERIKEKDYDDASDDEHDGSLELCMGKGANITKDQGPEAPAPSPRRGLNELKLEEENIDPVPTPETPTQPQPRLAEAEETKKSETSLQRLLGKLKKSPPKDKTSRIPIPTPSPPSKKSPRSPTTDKKPFTQASTLPSPTLSKTLRKHEKTREGLQTFTLGRRVSPRDEEESNTFPRRKKDGQKRSPLPMEWTQKTSNPFQKANIVPKLGQERRLTLKDGPAASRNPSHVVNSAERSPPTPKESPIPRTPTALPNALERISTSNDTRIAQKHTSLPLRTIHSPLPYHLSPVPSGYLTRPPKFSPKSNTTKTQHGTTHHSHPSPRSSLKPIIHNPPPHFYPPSPPPPLSPSPASPNNPTTSNHPTPLPALSTLPPLNTLVSPEAREIMEAVDRDNAAFRENRGLGLLPSLNMRRRSVEDLRRECGERLDRVGREAGREVRGKRGKDREEDRDGAEEEC